MNSKAGAPASGGAIGAWRLAAFVLTLAASVAPIFLGQAWPELFGDASRLAMACTPWVVIAGWPSGNPVARDWPLALGLALPVWALAGWLDLRLDLGPGRLQATLGAALLMTICLGEARTQASSSAPRAYALLWLLCLGALPAAALALSWGSGNLVSDGGPFGALGAFSPVTSLWRDVQPAEGDLARRGLDSALFCPASLVSVAMAVGFAAAARRSAGGRAR